jgi:UDP-N-acetylmuramate dehydrogenase
VITRHEAYDLSQRNTFGMKVSCRLFVEVTEPEDLLTLDFDALPQPLFVMGGGSNLLFTKDFPGTVLHLANQGISVIPGSTRNLLVRAGAGVVFDDFCAWAAQEGLWGPENLSLIPGEVGASAVQNIGAYGVEAKDIIDTVHAFDLTTRAFVDIPGADCAYGYRTSLFKTDWKGRYLITAVTFRLSTTPQPKLDYGGVRKALGDREPSPKVIRDTIIGIRREKLPDPEEIGSAGSFFCNPVIERVHFERIVALAKKENGPDYEVPHYDVGNRVKVPAAWMIDQCGFKGMKLGGAQVYPKQPLVIVNATGSATPEEIVALERRVIDTIRAKYDIELHPEVEHV